MFRKTKLILEALKDLKETIDGIEDRVSNLEEANEPPKYFGTKKGVK